MFNSVMSTKDAKFAAFDITNMHLNSKLESPEHMKICISLITPEIIKECNAMKHADKDGFVHFGITGAVCGLKVSGHRANQDLIKNLAPFGYYPSRRTPGLWHHKT